MPIYLGNVEAKKIYLGNKLIYGDGSSTDSGGSSGGSDSGGSSGGDSGSSVTYPSNCVDLGLPSGLRWATCNLDTTDPTDIGYYFQFGSNAGFYANEAKYFTWADSPCNGGSNTFNTTAVTNWDMGCVNSLTFCINSTSEADAAVGMWAEAGWRLPSYDDFVELYNSTTSYWATKNSIKCLQFVNKTDSSKFIYLPAGGYIPSTNNTAALTGSGTTCAYWTSSVPTLGSAYALAFMGTSSKKSVSSAFRSFNMPIRPVFDSSLAQS